MAISTIVQDTNTGRIVLRHLDPHCDRHGALCVLADVLGFASLEAAGEAWGGFDHLEVVHVGRA